MKPWHLRFSSEGRHPLFSTEASRRAAVRRLVRIAGDCLIGFSIADDHVHAAPYCDRQRSGVLLRTLHTSLQRETAVPIEESYRKPVETRRHLIWLVDYLLEQVDHHGLPAHAATWSGSTFQDLIGARVLPAFEPRVRIALPRYRIESAWRAVGLPPTQLRPADDREIRQLGAFFLAEAAASACCADPALTGRSGEVLAARNAASQIGVQCGIPNSELALALGVTERAVRRAATRPCDTRVHRAVRHNVSLHLLVDAHSRVERAS